MVATGTGDLPFGVARLLTGLVFCLGLVLVIVAAGGSRSVSNSENRDGGKPRHYGREVGKERRNKETDLQAAIP
jgi:hypothetical protein